MTLAYDDIVRWMKGYFQTYSTYGQDSETIHRMDDYMHDDYIQHNNDVPQGKAGFREFFVNTFKALPDFQYTVKKIVAEDDSVTVYSITKATHISGTWLGQPPTGNRLDFDFIDILRIENRMIAEHWDVADSLKLFTQLGIAKRLPTYKH